MMLKYSAGAKMSTGYIENNVHITSTHIDRSRVNFYCLILRFYVLVNVIQPPSPFPSSLPPPSYSCNFKNG